MRTILAASALLTLAACVTTPEMTAQEMAYCERMEREMGVEHRHDHAEAKSIGVNPMNVTHARCRQMLGMS
jgi:hypothetical protein